MRRSALHPLALRGSPSDSSRGKDEGLARADIKNRADDARLLLPVIPGRERQRANPESILRSRTDDAQQK
jgi:hypothetical protein